jgi:hypothetical protein
VGGQDGIHGVRLALILALLFGLATAAFGDNGDLFKLGKSNTATKASKLIKDGAGPALDLRVDSGAPLKVNSDESVDNLNADQVDGFHAGCLSGQLLIGGLCYDEERDDADAPSESVVGDGRSCTSCGELAGGRGSCGAARRCRLQVQDRYQDVQ